MESNDLRINHILIDWYSKNKRDLPWRETSDPYKIWLSEIILQQTRVDQGYSYYMRFVEEFPTVVDLAYASEDRVLKLWQGLGYYSRARNLHNAAQVIRDDFGGKFPSTHMDILSLKGVGDYTAAAIASFAYNLPYATVDGNVFRVLARLFSISEPIDTGKGKKVFTDLATELLDQQHPGLHNQAMMELGALQCVPVSPNCTVCPFINICMAYAEGKVSALPVKQGKIKTRKRYFNYFDIRYKDSVLLVKRTASDIWQNLYELPLIEADKSISLEELQASDAFCNMFGSLKIKLTEKQKDVKHVLSHQVIYANFYRVELDDLPHVEGLLKVNMDNLADYAISRLVDRYFESAL